MPEAADIMFATIQMLSHNVNKKNVNQIAKFINRLDDTPERQVQFWQASCIKNSDIVTAKPFLDFIENNKDLIL